METGQPQRCWLSSCFCPAGLCEAVTIKATLQNMQNTELNGTQQDW